MISAYYDSQIKSLGEISSDNEGPDNLNREQLMSKVKYLNQKLDASEAELRNKIAQLEILRDYYQHVTNTQESPPY